MISHFVFTSLKTREEREKSDISGIFFRFGGLTNVVTLLNSSHVFFNPLFRQQTQYLNAELNHDCSSYGNAVVP